MEARGRDFWGVVDWLEKYENLRETLRAGFGGDSV
jgi:hypothetical protein